MITDGQSDDSSNAEWEADRSYAIMIDAGSSGSRLQVYSWKSHLVARKSANETQLSSLPYIETGTRTGNGWHKKVHTGLATFAQNPSDVGKEHLDPLLKLAREIIPSGKQSQTPVFLSATAGMRLLPEEEQSAILSSACAYIQNATPFLLRDCAESVRVISGENEALYGWLAINYLTGGLNHPQDILSNNRYTSGFLDMGGASAQIAFAPNATEAYLHDQDLYRVRLRTLNGEPREWRVFVTTWLGFGANEAHRRYLESLQDAARMNRVFDPCSPVGLELKIESNTRLLGSGSLDGCIQQISPLLNLEETCQENDCLLVGAKAPHIDFNLNQFIGISEYWYLNHDVFDLGGAYNYGMYSQKVANFCATPWETIQDNLIAGRYQNSISLDKLEQLCFKSAWMMSVLHTGFGLPKDGVISDNANANGTTQDLIDSAREKGFHNSLTSVEKIGGLEVSWTLGQLALYVSSTVPPVARSTKMLPVGFGISTSQFGQNFAPLQATNSMHTSAALMVFLVTFSVLGVFMFIYRKRKPWMWPVRNFYRPSKRVMKASGLYESVSTEDDLEMPYRMRSRPGDLESVSESGRRSHQSLARTINTRSTSPSSSLGRRSPAMFQNRT